MKRLLTDEKKKMTLCCSVAFFVYLVIYNVVYVNGLDKWSITDITYTFHIVDFSMCVESGFIVGAIYNLLFKRLLPEEMAAYESVLIIALFLFVSIVLAKLICMDRYNRKERISLTVLSLFLFPVRARFRYIQKHSERLTFIFFTLLLFSLFFNITKDLNICPR